MKQSNEKYNEGNMQELEVTKKEKIRLLYFHLLPFKPSIFSIPIDRYVTTLPTGYNTKESHATGLT